MKLRGVACEFVKYKVGMEETSGFGVTIGINWVPY